VPGLFDLAGNARESLEVPDDAKVAVVTTKLLPERLALLGHGSVPVEPAPLSHGTNRA
jgi:hypothetical protein